MKAFVERLSWNMKLFVSFYSAPPWFGPVTYWNVKRPSTVAAYRKLDDAIKIEPRLPYASCQVGSSRDFCPVAKPFPLLLFARTSTL